MGLARRAAPLVVVAVVAGCSSTGPRSPAPTLPPAPATAAPAPATTAPAVPTTTTTTDPVVPVASPDAAANSLLAAWRAGDRGAARRVATAGAVTTLFSDPPQPVSDRGCQDPLAGRSMCAFGMGGGLVQVQTVMTLAGGWYVEAVTVNP